jgi:ribosomal protein S10
MIARAFPKIPDFTAQWMVVYWEPIPYSGELLTVLIAAKAETEWNVVPTLDDSLAVKLVDAPLKFLAPINLITESLRRHLANGQALESWKSPISGFRPSKVKNTRAENLSVAIRLAMRDTSVFSKLTDEIVQQSDRTDVIVDDDSKWPKQVEQAVVSTNPAYGKYFRRKLRLRSDARETPLDFWGTKYIANFARILPNTSISNYVNTAKVKLLNLEAIRSHASSESLFETELIKPDFELLVYRPSEDDPGYSDGSIKKLKEALVELEDFADGHDMRIEQFQTAKAAAERLIRKEAA